EVARGGGGKVRDLVPQRGAPGADRLGERAGRRPIARELPTASQTRGRSVARGGAAPTVCLRRRSNHSARPRLQWFPPRMRRQLIYGTPQRIRARRTTFSAT